MQCPTRKCDGKLPIGLAKPLHILKPCCLVTREATPLLPLLQSSAAQNSVPKTLAGTEHAPCQYIVQLPLDRACSLRWQK